MTRLNKEILHLAVPSILANITVPLVGMVDIAVAGHLGPGAGALAGMTAPMGVAAGAGAGLAAGVETTAGAGAAAAVAAGTGVAAGVGTTAGAGAAAVVAGTGVAAGVGAAALIGGISIGSMLFDILYWNFGFLRVGTGGLTAQAYGRRDWKDCAGILNRGIGLALFLARAVLVIQWPFATLALLFVDASPQVHRLALEYFFIRIWAAPATLSLMSLKGWFIGMQDTVSSMFTDLVVNGVNMAASIFLSIGGPGTGVRGIGVAGIPWGTVIAQYSGFLFAAVVIFTKYRKVVRGELTPGALKTAFKGGEMKRFAKVNGDLFVRSVALVLVYISFTVLSARYGDLLLASASIMMHLLLIFSYFTDGFAFAGEALTGRFIGARQPDQVRRTVKGTFVWSMGIGVSFVGIYALTGVPLLRLMTSDASVVEVSKQFLPWLVVMPLIGCPAFTWDGIYTGATATRALRNASVGSVLAFYAVWFPGIGLLGLSGLSRTPASGQLASAYGLTAIHVLLAAYFAHLVFRSLYQTVRYKRAVLSAAG